MSGRQVGNPWVDASACRMGQRALSNDEVDGLDVTRREFLKSLGVVAGAAGATAAGSDLLIPYLNQPESIVPGVSTWFATSCRECPAGCGMLIRNRESRAVKCEGNPSHPISQGRLCARGQAALQGLYDPDRVRGPKRGVGSGKFETAAWDEALKAVGSKLASAQSIALISDLQTGSLEKLMRSWMGVRLVVYEPIDYGPVKATNGGIVPTYRIGQSDFLISFACDFLENWVSPIEYAREFARMRETRDSVRGAFAYVGPRMGATACSADARLLIPPGVAEQVARSLVSGDTSGTASSLGLDKGLLDRIAQGLAAAQAPLAMPGWDMDSARAAAIVNERAGSKLIDRTRQHALSTTASMSDMTGLMADMETGKIDALLIFGVNPVFSLPDADRFVEALKRVKTIVSLSSYFDETAAHAHWVLPSSTPLESWGDYRPYPDVANLMQPVMGSVYDTRQTGDILLELARQAGGSPSAKDWYSYLRQQWAGSGDWDSLLQMGGKWTPVEAEPTASAELAAGTGVGGTSITRDNDEIRLWAFPHVYYYDGRGANRQWLQETPEPVTKAVWGSWAELHPETAKRLGVKSDCAISIERVGAKIKLPVYVWEGIAPGVVAVPIGEGHTHYGRFAKDIGVNVFPLLKPDSGRVNVTATGESKWLARIKGSTDQHGRDIAQTVPLEGQWHREEPVIMPQAEGYTKHDFIPPHKHNKHRWAMVVDMDKCIGCNACVTACYAENNVAVVGADGVWRRREMPWIRIDRYVDFREDSAPLLFQPMLCQHCDAAPCEPVCPVFAAAHSDEGLNMQVYNRCVGTRYCSNNCPYKVRRFNWFGYDWPEPLNWQLNPDVTVRCRGVMEKCTFCVQRIREVKITAKREGRPVRDGEVVPACVQTCPTGVFTFGDLMDPSSEVSRLFNEDPRAYQVLRELNTKPAVLYLKRIVA